MTRPTTLSLIVLGLLASGATGYWFGGQHAKEAYGVHFTSESFAREYHEARHDIGFLRLLSENNIDGARQVAQYRYYNRLLLAADLATESPNQHLLEMLQGPLAEAREFQKSHSFQFPTEQDRNKWEALIKSTR